LADATVGLSMARLLLDVLLYTMNFFCKLG